METPDRAIASLFIIPLTLFFIGVLLFLALFYGHRDLTILTLLVLGLALGTKLWAGVSLSGITDHSGLDRQRAFPGEKLTFRLELKNAKFLPVWFRVKVPVGSGLFFPSDEKPFVREGSLLWHQQARFACELTAKRRGVHPIGPSHIETGDLFAFFSREKRDTTIYQVIVYPRLIPLKTFPLPRHDVFGVPGAQSPVQDPVYLLGTRDYQHGQPAKTIHWKASARYNRLQGKVFEPSEQEKVLLVVEVEQFAKANAEDAFEHTLEAVASLAVRLTVQGYAVGLMTNGALFGGTSGMIPVARSLQQLPAILELLARLKMESRGGLLETMEHGSSLSWGLTGVVFSYKEDPATFMIRSYFERRRIPVVSFVYGLPPWPADREREGRDKVYNLNEIALPFPLI